MLSFFILSCLVVRWSSEWGSEWVSEWVIVIAIAIVLSEFSTPCHLLLSHILHFTFLSFLFFSLFRFHLIRNPFLILFLLYYSCYRDREVVLVEGYFDVIALHDIGGTFVHSLTSSVRPPFSSLLFLSSFYWFPLSSLRLLSSSSLFFLSSLPHWSYHHYTSTTTIDNTYHNLNNASYCTVFYRTVQLR